MIFPVIKNNTEVQMLVRRGIVWENHACMPLRPGDTSFLPQLERVRKAGINVISLNCQLRCRRSERRLQSARHIPSLDPSTPEHYVLADTVADIEVAKARTPGCDIRYRRRKCGRGSPRTRRDLLPSRRALDALRLQQEQHARRRLHG